MSNVIDFPGSKSSDGSWLFGMSEGSIHIKPEKDETLTIASALFLLEACRINLLQAVGVMPSNAPRS